MDLISPSRAARAFGVSESSLKRWCDDGLIPVVRTAGGHRKLAASDLLQFAREQKRPLAAPDVLGLPALRERSAAGLHRLRPEFTKALLAGDERRALQIVLDLFVADHSPAVICDEVIAGAFREIGERWSCREAEVYQERRGCEIVIRILYELRRLLPASSSSRTALCATLNGDHYLLPPAMAETVLLTAGFHAVSLGHHIPTASLTSAVERIRPEVLCLCVSSVADEHEFVADIDLLAKACERRRTALVVGGRALNESLRTRLNYAAYCDTMRQLETLARVLIGKRPRRTKSAAAGQHR
ncbi:MAG: B12-binding domain-containing protein [Planctomycetia bacterium]|nr:B12-binding domain-containing protein [Planctomycetia bacterium]